MITLIKNYKYDNSYEYVKTFSNKSEQNSYFNTLPKIIINDNEYIKDHNSFRVKYNYDDLLIEGVNYLTFNNGSKDMYAFITRKEFVNEQITILHYEIDVFQSFLFNFTIDKSFVERKVCTIDEITDFDEGLEIGEHEVKIDQVVIDKNYKMFAMFNGFKDYYVNADGTNYQEMKMQSDSRPLTKIDGINYPILFIALDDESIIDIFYKYLVDLPNLIGVIRLPNCEYTKSNMFLPFVKVVNDRIIKTGVGISNAVTTITSINVTGEGVAVPKGDITDFYPYTYYLLTDGECEPLTLLPQYCSSSITINGKFALSHTPIERYFPTYYKGSTNGNIYNITNMSNMMLPSGTNGGVETLTANMNSFEQQKKSLYGSVLTSAIALGGGIATGNVAGAMIGINSAIQGISSYNAIKENMARTKDLELTPSSIKSYGTPSARNAFNLNTVRVVKYSIQDKYKTRVNNFIKRYGNKYNNFATIDLKSYKGYIKFSSPNLDGGIDNIFMNKLSNILERGVYIE